MLKKQKYLKKILKLLIKIYIRILFLDHWTLLFNENSLESI